jgi:hypothetical protein
MLFFSIHNVWADQQCGLGLNSVTNQYFQYFGVPYIFTKERQVIDILVTETLQISALKKIGKFVNVVSIERNLGYMYASHNIELFPYISRITCD